MSPDDKGKDEASIGLSLSKWTAEKYQDVLEQLEIGDQIIFNGTIVGLGDQLHLHHLHAFDLERGNERYSVKPHYHEGRYKMKLS